MDIVPSPLVLLGTEGTHKDESYIIWYPNPEEVFLCSNLPGTEAVLKDLRNQVFSAINRHVSHLPPYTEPYPSHPTEFPWQAYSPPSGAGGNMFYQANGLVDDPGVTTYNQWNTYSQVLHELAIQVDGKGKIYGFAYDDNAKQSDSLDVAAATEFRLTINNCLLPNMEPILYLLLD
jgi:hypothetical protein